MTRRPATRRPVTRRPVTRRTVTRRPAIRRPVVRRPDDVRERTEPGAATVLVVALTSVLLLVGCGVAAVAGLLHARRAAEAAADLAALAGAVALRDGADGCAAAGRVAARNGASLRSCRAEGADVVVATVVSAATWAGLDVEVPGSARAGPAP